MVENCKSLVISEKGAEQVDKNRAQTII